MNEIVSKDSGETWDDVFNRSKNFITNLIKFHLIESSEVVKNSFELELKGNETESKNNLLHVF